MNGETRFGDRYGRAAGMDFPAKTHPNRPASAAGEACREMRGEARPFSPRCDPYDPRRPLTEEQRKLARRFIPLARKLAFEMKDTRLDLEELRAEAYAALVDAARAFDPEHGAHFSVYARPRIVGALRDYRRFALHAGQEGQPSELPVFERLRMSDDVHGTVIGKRPEPPPGQEIEALELVESVFRRLPGPQAVACRSIYLEGKSANETAADLGYSEGYLSRLHGDALTAIRREYRAALAG